MCSRFLTPNQGAIERHYHLGRGQNNHHPQGSYFAERYNVTQQQGNPTAYVPVIRHSVLWAGPARR
jgi:hypothetical protein